MNKMLLIVVQIVVLVLFVRMACRSVKRRLPEGRLRQQQPLQRSYSVLSFSWSFWKWITIFTLSTYCIVVRGPNTSNSFLENYSHVQMSSHSIQQSSRTVITAAESLPKQLQQQQQLIPETYHPQQQQEQQQVSHSQNNAMFQKSMLRDDSTNHNHLRVKNSLPTKTLKRLQEHDNVTISTTFTNTINITRKKKKSIKVLLFITTIFSDYHTQLFHCCWPKLLQHSQLLSKVHIAIFSNNVTQIPPNETYFTRQLFVNNPSFKFLFPSDSDLDAIAAIPGPKVRFQNGANLGPKLAFQHNNTWLTIYDWIIRVNPDVLIRQSDWLYQTMNNPEVDAVLVKCERKKVHTDFFAVRPDVLWEHWPDQEDSPFANMQLSPISKQNPDNQTRWVNHESTAFYYFEPILSRKRHEFLPDHEPSAGICRIRGTQSPIVHDHEYCQVDANVCEGLEGWDIT
jgi:hypothetical protein